MNGSEAIKEGGCVPTHGLKCPMSFPAFLNLLNTKLFTEEPPNHISLGDRVPMEHKWETLL